MIRLRKSRGNIVRRKLGELTRCVINGLGDLLAGEGCDFPYILELVRNSERLLSRVDSASVILKMGYLERRSVRQVSLNSRLRILSIATYLWKFEETGPIVSCSSIHPSACPRRGLPGPAGVQPLGTLPSALYVIFIETNCRPARCQCEYGIRSVLPTRKIRKSVVKALDLFQHSLQCFARCADSDGLGVRTLDLDARSDALKAGIRIVFDCESV